MTPDERADSHWWAVQDTAGNWWSPDGRYRWDGTQWHANELSFSRVPLSDESAKLIRRGAATPRVILWVLAVGTGSISAILVLAGLYPLAFFFGLWAIGAGVAAFFSGSYARQDVREGALTRATGMMVIRDRVNRGQYGLQRRCQLDLGKVKFSWSDDEIADAICRNASLIRHESNLVSPQDDWLIFNGSVDYASRTRILFSIQTADGQQLWRHPGPGLHLPGWLRPKNWLDGVGLVMGLAALIAIAVIDAGEGLSLGLAWLIAVNLAALGLVWCGSAIRRAATHGSGS